MNSHLKYINFKLKDILFILKWAIWRTSDKNKIN